jgi:TonB family protein
MKRQHLLLILIALLAFALGVHGQSPTANVNTAGLFPVSRDWKMGYIDRTGRIVIPLEFAVASPFSEGLAAVSPDMKVWGYIDTSGKMVIPPQFAIANRFSEDLAYVVFPDGQPAFIERSGAVKLKLAPEAGMDLVGTEFTQGIAAVRVGTIRTDLPHHQRPPVYYGNIDKSGKVVIPPNKLTEACARFSEGLCGAHVGNLTGFMDTAGNFVIPPKFMLANDFSEGVAQVFVGRKYGLIDKTGAYVVEPKFDLMAAFMSEGLIEVKLGDQVGFADRTGALRFTIPVSGPVSGLGARFKEGLAAVQVENGYGYVDKLGKFVIEPKFVSASPFVDGLARVTVDYQSDAGLIDHSGQFVWKPEPRKSPPPQFTRRGSVEITSSLPAAEVVQQIAPAYPPMAQMAGIDGVVVLALTVAPDGSVTAVRSERGHPFLAGDAIAAAWKWRYAPAGQQRQVRAEVKFTLQSPGPQEGYWEVSKPGSGGIGSALELRGDGTYLFVITVMVDLNYSLSADTLTLYDPKGSQTSIPSLPVRIQDGILIVGVGTSNELKKERVGAQAPGTTPIVGVWKYRHYTGAVAYERYTTDGHMQLRIAMREDHGQYSAVNGRITLEGDRPGLATTYELENGELVTHSQDGKTFQYRRLQEGRWYGAPDVRIAPSAEAAIPLTAPVQIRVIEFGDHPDPNTGTPHALETAQAWPSEIDPLVDAVFRAVEGKVSVYDIRHCGLAAGATVELLETTVRVIDVATSAARISVRMHADATPQPVEVTVPMNGTVVIGSEAGDQHHAYVAVSLFDRAMSARIPEVFSMYERGITRPVKVSGAELQATAAAREHHLKGVVVQMEIDEQGNVVTAHAHLGRYPSASDQAMIEKTVRTWKFEPAKLNGKPVRVLADITANFPR